MGKPVKGQIAIEFAMIVGISIVTFIVMYIAYIEQVERLSLKREGILTEDLASSIQKELIIAGKVSDGYFRQFIIPATLEGTNYTLSKENITLFVETTRQSSIRRIPTVVGEPRKGANSINKSKGVIYLN